MRILKQDYVSENQKEKILIEITSSEAFNIKNCLQVAINQYQGITGFARVKYQYTELFNLFESISKAD